MTTLNNLVTEAHKIYQEMETARWGNIINFFGLIRTIKAPLLDELSKKDAKDLPQALNDLNNSDIVQAGTKLKTITAILVLCSNVEQNPRVGKHTKKEELAKLTEAFLTEFPGKDNFSAMALLFLNENLGQKRSCTLFNENATLSRRVHDEAKYLARPRV